MPTIHAYAAMATGGSLQPFSFDPGEIGPEEVEIKVSHCGICHSDLSIQQGRIPYPTPCVLGHEAAGEVIEIGDGVTNVKVGDHVVCMWTPMCGDCFMCRRGQTHLCERARAMGMMDDGTSRLSLNVSVTAVPVRRASSSAADPMEVWSL